MNKKFIDFMSNYAGARLAVAVSGGVDSVCLLCWLAKIGADVTALHVNHGLRPGAEIESQYVRDLCKKLDIPCHVFYWTGAKPSTGLEAAARDTRYKFMTDFCHENNIGTLLVAHQADDQIETFLMNLGRGSGLYGMAAMRPVTYRDGIQIVRPLLDIYRSELKQYCDAGGIKYFSDEMNDDVRYTRVKIRKNRHVLSEMLGISDDRILLAAKNLGRVRDAIERDIDEHIRFVMKSGYALFSDSFLFDQAVDIRLKLLGTLIQKIGGNEYRPRLNSLNIALEKLKTDCKFTLGHCTVRRHNCKILIVPEGEKTSFRRRMRNEKNKRNIEQD